MFSNDGHTYAEPEASAATRALCGVERIENARQRFRANAHAIVLNGNGKLVFLSVEANLDAARVTDLANSLLGIGDEIQQDLNELIGVANDAGEIRLRAEIHFDKIAT